MNKKAFTLAEVLITLAIIGVVAALTIPAVVKNYQKTQTVTKLKKAWSTINQAYNNSQAQNGMYQTWDKAVNIGAAEYFNRYWKPYLKVAKICNTYQECGYNRNDPWKYSDNNQSTTSVVATDRRITFLSPDGTVFVIFALIGTSVPGETVEYNDIYIDLNGAKGPNKFGRDLFILVRTDKGILPECYNSSVSTINNECSKTGGGNCCAAKLARDGWEIKDAYPW